MASNQEVLKEFLVSIGFDVNQADAKRVADATTKLEKQIVGSIKNQDKAEKDAAESHKRIVRDAVLQARLWGDAIEAAGRQIFNSLKNVTAGYENLYYISKRTGTSVGELKAFGYAIGQMGGSAEEAYAALDTLADKMRETNGAYEGIFRSFGVKKGPLGEEVIGLAKAMADQHKTTAEAAAQFGVLGIPRNVWLPIYENAKEFDRRRAEMRGKQEAAGLDPTKIANDARDFQNSVNSLSESWSNLQAKIISALIAKPPGGGESIIERITKMVDNLSAALKDAEVQQTLNRITDAVLGLVDAIGQLAKQIDKVAQSTPGGYATVFKSAISAYVGNQLYGTVGALVGAVAGASSSVDMGHPLGGKAWADGQPKGLGYQLGYAAHGLYDALGLNKLFDMGAHADTLSPSAGKEQAMAHAAAQLQRIADLLMRFLSTAGFGGVLGGPGATADGGAGLSAGGGVSGTEAAPLSVWGHAKRIAGNVVGPVLRAAGIKTDLGTRGRSPTLTATTSMAPEVKAVLDSVASEEGADYNTLAGAGHGNMGAPATFSDYSKHPNIPAFRHPDGSVSTGAGHFQFEHSTWETYRKKYNLPDFGKTSQDWGAWYDASDHYLNSTGRDLLTDLKARRPGTIESLQQSLRGEWAAAKSGGMIGVYNKRLSAYMSESAAAANVPAAAPTAAAPAKGMLYSWEKDGSGNALARGHSWSSLQGSSGNALARAHNWSESQGSALSNIQAKIEHDRIKFHNFDILHRPQPLTHPMSSWAPRGDGGSRSASAGARQNVYINVHESGDPQLTGRTVASSINRQYADIAKTTAPKHV